MWAGGADGVPMEWSQSTASPSDKLRGKWLSSLCGGVYTEVWVSRVEHD